MEDYFKVLIQNGTMSFLVISQLIVKIIAERNGATKKDK